MAKRPFHHRIPIRVLDYPVRVALEMLPGWMPDELRQLGYDGIITGEDKRILAHAIEQKLTLMSSGAYETLVEASAKPVARSGPMPGSPACCATASPWNDAECRSSG